MTRFIGTTIAAAVVLAALLVLLVLGTVGCASIAGYQAARANEGQRALLVGHQGGQVTFGVNLLAPMDYVKEHPWRALLCAALDAVETKAVYKYAKDKGWVGGDSGEAEPASVDTHGGDYIYIDGDGNTVRQERKRK